MKKLKMTASKGLTFEEGCNKYLEYCRQRNLREGTIRHYRQKQASFIENKAFRLKSKVAFLKIEVAYLFL